MRSEPVRIAIDLETTGLRPDQDAITEIGAVKFAGPRILDTFQSFVNITSALPYRIHRLTGITASDLRHAPPLSALLGPLRAFIGSAPLVGHSVAFDAAFLRRAGLARRNPLLDTYELASMLLPDLPSYTLASVADALKVPSSIHHRALADADLARAVFLALMERLSALDTATIEELAALPVANGWSPAYLLRSEARAREEAIKSSPFASLLAAAPTGRRVEAGIHPALLTMAVGLEPAPAASAPAAALAAPDAGDAGEERGALGDFMAEGGALLLELERKEDALVAALAEAARGVAPGRQTLVAASDSDEMKRIARSLLPRAIAQAELEPERISIAELDERSGYLCLHRWLGVARDDLGAALSNEVTRGLAKLTIWARETHSGQRADLALTGGESEAWARARGGDEFAEAFAECPYRAGGYCFVQRATQRANDAALVVTTHAALAARLTGHDQSAPLAERTILLDGRRFEDELRRQRTFTLEAARLFNALDALETARVGGEHAGLLPFAASLAPVASASQAEEWYRAVTRAREAAGALFGAMRALLHEGQERSGRGARREMVAENGSLRIDSTVRGSHGWQALAHEWAQFSDAIGAVCGAIDAAARAIQVSEDAHSPAAFGARGDLLGLARRLRDLRARGGEVISGRLDETGEQWACWLRAPQPQQGQQVGADTHRRDRRAAPRSSGDSSEPAGDANGDMPEERAAEDGEQLDMREALLAEALTLVAAPVQVGAALAPLWAEGRGMAALGWSLSVGGDVDYIRTTLGFPDSARALPLTPNYTGQTLLCLPTDAPEPAAQSYQAQFEALIVALARALDGDVVALFPSHAALRAAALGISRTLERDDILALAQGIDGSARQLWQSFNDQPRTVLLGAGTFWDGAEQRNRPPACIVVARTPFPPQSDPLVAARASLWPDQQAQFMTPQAALKLRQALGGLAWSHRRRNAIVLYDKRLQTRGYGETILDALPQCELYQARAADLAERIAEWTRDANN
ncbi:MAG TPA: exonuclease domain-containing protein [Ktedonobacterales bacterium]|nr:exonuclease domain-containing protein [Ktedonobacterales bacterium]